MIGVQSQLKNFFGGGSKMAKISWTTPLKMWPKFFFSIFFLNCKVTSITLSVHHELNVFKAIADRFPIETY